MDNDKILREILSITKENHQMIKNINRQRRFGNIFWVIKILIILVLAYSAYRAATPYIETYNNAIENINSFSNQAKQMSEFDNKSFTDFLQKEIKKRLGQ